MSDEDVVRLKDAPGELEVRFFWPKGSIGQKYGEIVLEGPCDINVKPDKIEFEIDDSNCGIHFVHLSREEVEHLLYLMDEAAGVPNPDPAPPVGNLHARIEGAKRKLIELEMKYEREAARFKDEPEHALGYIAKNWIEQFQRDLGILAKEIERPPLDESGGGEWLARVIARLHGLTSHRNPDWTDEENRIFALGVNNAIHVIEHPEQENQSAATPAPVPHREEGERNG